MDKGPKTRAGFQAVAEINRHDFGVSWNQPLLRNGIVVGNNVELRTWSRGVLGLMRRFSSRIPR
jgi:polyisoprenoid-binding protein YceI